MKKSAARSQKSSKQPKMSFSSKGFNPETERACSDADQRSTYPTHESLARTEQGIKKQNKKKNNMFHTTVFISQICCMKQVG